MCLCEDGNVGTLQIIFKDQDWIVNSSHFASEVQILERVQRKRSLVTLVHWTDVVLWCCFTVCFQSHVFGKRSHWDLQMWFYRTLQLHTQDIKFSSSRTCLSIHFLCLYIKIFNNVNVRHTRHHHLYFDRLSLSDFSFGHLGSAVNKTWTCCHLTNMTSSWFPHESNISRVSAQYHPSFSSVFGLHHLLRETCSCLAAKCSTVFTSLLLTLSVCCSVLSWSSTVWF